MHGLQPSGYGAEEAGGEEYQGTKRAGWPAKGLKRWKSEEKVQENEKRTCFCQMFPV